MILAGGFGTRLREVVSDRPKPMALVAGKPFLEWLILQAKSHGVARVILCTGHMAEIVQNYFGDGRRWGIEIVYSKEETPLGTAGAIRQAWPFVRGPMALVMNGDSYCAFNLAQMEAAAREKNAQAVMWLAQVEDASRYGAVRVDEKGWVSAFTEKSAIQHNGQNGQINAGVYVLSGKVVDGIPAGRSVSLEREIFPGLIGQGLAAILGDGAFLDIGLPDSYRRAAHTLKSEFKMLDKSEFVRGYVQESAAVMQNLATHCAGDILQAAQLLVDVFRAGGKALICGNGGSAADAQHLAAEFMSRLTQDFVRPAIPAIALTTDTSFLTAFTNDEGFENVFARQVEGLGKPGDALIGISTSGNSKNVLAAVRAARARNMRVVTVTGTGGQLRGLAHCAIAIPSSSTQHVQESSLAVYHMLCHIVEREVNTPTPDSSQREGGK